MTLQATGDTMQSAASRVLDFAEGLEKFASYEERMAMIELRASIDRWTELRRLA